MKFAEGTTLYINEWCASMTYRGDGSKYRIPFYPFAEISVTRSDRDRLNARYKLKVYNLANDGVLDTPFIQAERLESAIAEDSDLRYPRYEVFSGAPAKIDYRRPMVEAYCPCCNDKNLETPSPIALVDKSNPATAQVDRDLAWSCLRCGFTYYSSARHDLPKEIKELGQQYRLNKTQKQQEAEPIGKWLKNDGLGRIF